jgi:hypothetical protein
MPKYKISFAVVGHTTTIVTADDEKDARELFWSQDWTAADEDWEGYEINAIEAIDDAAPDKP